MTMLPPVIEADDEPDYVEVTFRVHREDCVGGLSVLLLNAGGVLLPMTQLHLGNHSGRKLSEQMSHRSEATTDEDGVKTVTYQLYGGTAEQFEHTAERQREYCKVHGWIYGGSVHLPRSVEPPLKRRGN